MNSKNLPSETTPRQSPLAGLCQSPLIAQGDMNTSTSTSAGAAFAEHASTNTSETNEDLVLTDPPYGMGMGSGMFGNGVRKLHLGENDWNDTPPDLKPIISLGVPCVIWGGNYFPLPVSRGWFVWDKGTGENHFSDAELAWTNRDAVLKLIRHSWVGANAKERMDADRFHPTQKPIPVMTWCLGFFPDAQTILDPFMGSGTTLVAAKLLGRRAIGIEIEEKYCEIAVQRLAQDSLFEIGGVA